MLFLFRIAENLGQSVEWVCHNVSLIELQGWAKYYEYKAKETKKANARRK